MEAVERGLCPRDGPFEFAQGKLRPSLHVPLGFAFAGQPKGCPHIRDGGIYNPCNLGVGCPV
jgi:hypothetical protein